MMQGLMYLHVSIVSADALELAWSIWVLTQALLDISICCFDCGTKSVKFLELFDNFQYSQWRKYHVYWRSFIITALNSPNLHYKISQLVALSIACYLAISIV